MLQFKNYCVCYVAFYSFEGINKLSSSLVEGDLTFLLRPKKFALEMANFEISFHFHKREKVSAF